MSGGRAVAPVPQVENVREQQASTPEAREDDLRHLRPPPRKAGDKPREAKGATDPDPPESPAAREKQRHKRCRSRQGEEEQMDPFLMRDDPNEREEGGQDRQRKAMPQA